MQLTLVLPWWARLLRRARTTASTPPVETPRAGRRLRVLRPVGGRGDGEPGPTLDDLYRARRLDMIRLAVFLVDDLHTAEDVVQDAFAAVCRRHGSRLDSLQDAHAYLHTAVVNAARSVLRRRRTARAYTPPYQGPGAPVDEPLLLAEEHRQVLDALARLTPRQREVLVLRYWSELTEAQIAEALGVSRGTVKSTASRALVTLEKLLEAAR
ncbi:SigE family RNA polymerase sigma factor [Streptomyces iranensis]|uniref:RNA polymerase sigma-70 factor (Sigma-E family) n=1 Tax=Streptomyces iranensis TaxID=576784 RepID=A0A061A2R7_9ACTN|nr:SigE family RNA polymerase sigma factor [Streptomyces iranensis]MBP2061478.1 RNA polymerase sigma-70 factor (sigma-E family) [Streptomyces iranensis]CDR09704.1 RNA polymerase, sigma-24 subunit, ECF subfamily [Streptomyces iranensis]